MLGDKSKAENKTAPPAKPPVKTDKSIETSEQSEAAKADPSDQVADSLVNPTLSPSTSTDLASRPSVTSLDQTGSLVATPVFSLQSSLPASAPETQEKGEKIVEAGKPEESRPADGTRHIASRYSVDAGKSPTKRKLGKSLAGDQLQSVLITSPVLPATGNPAALSTTSVDAVVPVAGTQSTAVAEPVQLTLPVTTDVGSPPVEESSQDPLAGGTSPAKAVPASDKSKGKRKQGKSENKGDDVDKPDETRKRKDEDDDPAAGAAPKAGTQVEHRTTRASSRGHAAPAVESPTGKSGSSSGKKHH